METITKEQLQSVILTCTSYSQLQKKLGCHRRILKRMIIQFDLSTSHFLGRAWNRKKKYPIKLVSLDNIFSRELVLSNFSTKKIFTSRKNT